MGNGFRLGEDLGPYIMEVMTGMSSDETRHENK
jgi:hypothetical protein